MLNLCFVMMFLASFQVLPFAERERERERERELVAAI